MEPFINLEDPVQKTVGNRRPPTDAFAHGMGLQRLGRELAKTFGVRAPRSGVYRFHSHEEADEWMMQILIGTRKG